jgi:hypothetical protein
MAKTIYASFVEASLAEQVADVLLDNGIKPEDLSVVRSATTDERSTAYGRVSSAADPLTEGTPHWINIDNPGGFAGGQAFLEIAEEATIDATGHTNPPGAGYDDTYDRLGAIDQNESLIDSAESVYDRPTSIGVVDENVGTSAPLASVFVPNVGLVLGEGELAASMGGLPSSASNQSNDVIRDSLVAQGVDEEVARDYEQTVKYGGALISVAVPTEGEEESLVRALLSRFDASNVHAYIGRSYLA